MHDHATAYMHVRATVCTWKSEDNVRELVLSFYPEGLGIKLKLTGLVASTFTYWAICFRQQETWQNGHL